METNGDPSNNQQQFQPLPQSQIQLGQVSAGKLLKPVPLYIASALYGISISLVVLGSICVTFGTLSFGIPRLFYTPMNAIGTNVWVGIFYIIGGSLGIARQSNPTNKHLTNAYYAFTILGILCSLPQLAMVITSFITGDTLAGMTSVLFPICGFSFSMTLLILLSRYVYCATHATCAGNAYSNLTDTDANPNQTYGVVFQPVAVTVQQPSG